MQIKILNLGRYQHYKNRNPPWIKVHRDVLVNRSHASLSDAAWRLSVELVILAAEIGSDVIEMTVDDLRWRLHHRVKLADIESLEKTGFLEICKHDASNVLATCKQVAPDSASEVRVQRQRSETETDGQRRGTPRPLTERWRAGFDELWKAYPRKVAKGQARKTFDRLMPKNGGSPEALYSAIARNLTERLREWDDRPITKIPHMSTWLLAEEFEA